MRREEEGGVSRRETRREEEEGGVSGDLRVRLSQQLTRGEAECLVCLDRVRQTQHTWDCGICYQVGL